MLFRYLTILLIPIFSFGMSVGQEFINHINSFRLLKIDFTQEFYPTGYDTPIYSAGIIYIENTPPFRIKLYYKKPNKFILLYNGENTILYNVNSHRYYKSEGEPKQIQSLGIFNKKFTDGFKPILSAKDGEYYKIVFTPRYPNQKNISFIVLKIDKKLNPKTVYVFTKDGFMYIKINDFKSLKDEDNIFKISK